MLHRHCLPWFLSRRLEYDSKEKGRGGVRSLEPVAAVCVGRDDNDDVDDDGDGDTHADADAECDTGATHIVRSSSTHSPV